MYDYVTRSQVERTNELIAENNEILIDVNNNINFYGGIVVFILVLAIIVLPISRAVLGVRNGK